MHLSAPQLVLLSCFIPSAFSALDWTKVLKAKPGLRDASPTKAKTIDRQAAASSVIAALEARHSTAQPVHPVQTKHASIAQKHQKKTSKKSKSKPKSTTKPKPISNAKTTRKHHKRDACAPQSIAWGYQSSPNTPSGFLNDMSLHQTALNSLPVAGYLRGFADAYASLSANNYISYSQLSSYNVSQCAQMCDSISICRAFNIYFERDPMLDPGTGCANPTASVSVRCALWGSQVSASQTLNIGEFRKDFMIAVVGSNGFNKNPVPITLPGLQVPVALAGAVDPTILPSTIQFLDYTFTAGPYDAAGCAKSCSAKTASNKAAALLSGGTYTACNWINAFTVNYNGLAQGTYCQLLSADASAYASQYTQTVNGVVYDLTYSYGYAQNVVDSGSIAVSSAVAPVGTIVSSAGSQSSSMSSVASSAVAQVTSVAAPTVSSVSSLAASAGSTVSSIVSQVASAASATSISSIASPAATTLSSVISQAVVVASSLDSQSPSFAAQTSSVFSSMSSVSATTLQTGTPQLSTAASTASTVVSQVTSVASSVISQLPSAANVNPSTSAPATSITASMTFTTSTTTTTATLVTRIAYAAFTTITVNSGTATSLLTSTIAPAVSGGTATVQITYPTAVQTCGNSAVAYAAYTGISAGLNGLAGLLPENYKTTTPAYSGSTTYMGELNDALNTAVTIYGNTQKKGQALLLNHKFYIFANQPGQYTISVPYADDIAFAWTGSKAVSGWTRANADLTIQLGAVTALVGGGSTVTANLTTGQYLPVRIAWANIATIGDYRVLITGPDGSIMASTNGNAGTLSQNIVQFPCNSALGASYPAWGAEI